MDSLAFENSEVFKLYNTYLKKLDNCERDSKKIASQLEDFKSIESFEKLQNSIRSNAELKAKFAGLQVALQDPDVAKLFHPKFAEAIMMLNLENV